MLPNLYISVLPQNFAIRQVQGCWFPIWQKEFFKSNPKLPRDSIFGKKYWNKAFFVQNLSIFVSSQNLELEKFEGDDFRYDNSFLKF